MPENLLPTLQDLMEQFNIKTLGEFVPCAWYNQQLDWLIYLTEDVVYRSSYMGADICFLLHPYEDKLVGIKIENWSNYLRQYA